MQNYDAFYLFNSVPVGSMLHILLELSQGALLVMSHMHCGYINYNRKENRRCQTCSVMYEVKH